MEGMRHERDPGDTLRTAGDERPVIRGPCALDPFGAVVDAEVGGVLHCKRCRVGGEDDGPQIGGAEAVCERSQVSVVTGDDELVERGVAGPVGDVEGDAEVGSVLVLARGGRTVDELEAGIGEVGAEPSEEGRGVILAGARERVVGAEVSLPAWKSRRPPSSPAVASRWSHLRG